MIGCLALATIAALPAAEPPQVLVVMPKPKDTLPKLEPALVWVQTALPHMAPSRWRRKFGPLAVDPFAPEDWTRTGLDPEAPMLIWQTEPRSRPVAAARILDAAQLEKTAAAISTQKVRSAEGGWLVGPPGNPSLVFARNGPYLLARLHRNWVPVSKKDRATAEAKWVKALHDEARPPKMPSTGAADLYIDVRKRDAIEQAHGTVRFEKTRVEVQGRIDLARGPATALRPLVPIGPVSSLIALPADRVTAQLVTRGTPAAILETLGLGAQNSIARQLDGRIHVILTNGGSMIVAVGLRKSLPPAVLKGMTQTLRDPLPGLKLEAKGRYLVAWFDGPDAETVRPQLTVPKKPPKHPGAWAELYPPRLADALGARGQGTGPQVRAGIVPLLRVGYGDLLSGASRVVMSVIRTKGVTNRFAVTSWLYW